jgi:hypothetical protein
MDDTAGLSEALNDGDAVVLSTGANATVRGAYPKGHRGDVRIVLDGVEQVERADGFLILHPQPMPATGGASEHAVGKPPIDEGRVRAPDRRMQD